MLFLATFVLLLATGVHCCEINCQQGGKHRNPQNRNSYIDCQNGKGFLVWCALSGDGFTRKTFNGKECIEPFACPRVSGKFRHPHNRDYYWNCENGLATLERCPNGLTFDGQSLCVERYECPELMGNFANSLNKSQYYECCYGEPTLHTCPKGFQFDSDLRCVETFVCPQPNGFFRNMRKENQYYECRDGEPIPRTCRPKHIFDGIDRCIEKFDCPLPEGNFVNRNDPSNRTYYLCRSGVATLVNCPHHYIFFGQECDEPFRCPRPDGRFSHPRNDTKYYMCDNNIAFPHACAPGLQFDDSKQTCLRPWLCPSAFGKFRHPDNTSLYYLCDNGRHRLVHCPAETTFDGQQCVPNYRCPESDGMFRHPTKENKYYYCRGGTPSLQECPIDYIYDELQRTCSPKDSVFVCPQPNGYFPHRYNEQIYYECEDGRPRVRQCTVQQRFDRRKQTCVDIRKPVLEFDCPRPDGLFADRTNESRFHHCRDGVPHLRDCGPNRRFDERVQNCVASDRVPPPYVCPEPEGIFAHPTNESRFYFCRENTPHLSECQSGQVFDPYHKTCVRRSDPPTPPVFRCPRPTGLFADPNSERRYYQCTNSVPYLRECGYNQIFDARYQRCLDREQSGCQCPRPNGYFAYPYNKKRYLLCRQNVCEVRECATEEIFDSRSSRCVSIKIETGKCRQPNGLFRHETNSSRFYYCRNNRAELRECPGYQIFDEEVGGCIPWSWPNNFYCPLPNGLFTNPQNQSQYFECCSGRATLRSCPCKQIFNGQHCISEVVYQCEDNRPPHQCYNGQRYHYSCPYQYGRPELVYNGYRCVEPYHCPNSLGTQVIVNPVHNHQYYRCVNGQPTLNTCSRGYAYDPSRGCCVYEQRNVPGYNDYDARPQQPPGPRHPTGSVGHTVPGVPVQEGQVDPVYPDRRRPTYPDRDRPSYPAIVVPIQPESSYTVSSFLPTVAKPPEVIELEPQTEVITLPEAVAHRKDPQDDSVTRPARGDIDYANGESEPDDDEDDYNGNENDDKW